MGRLLALLALCALTLAGQSEGRNKLGLPNPAKQDIPYLIQASEIHELEQTEATPEEVKNQMRYWMAGTASAVKTPLASPEFLFDSKDIDPRDLSLYRFEVVKGRRELLFREEEENRREGRSCSTSRASRTVSSASGQLQSGTGRVRPDPGWTRHSVRIRSLLAALVPPV